MSYVFISYNQVDSDIAALMMMQLEKAGFDTWLDKQRLRGGMDWSVEIDRGISEAFALVVIMSPDAKASEYVTYEWSYAIGAGVPVVPVLIRETELHPRLARLQYLDFTNNARPWEKLIKELQDMSNAGIGAYRIPSDTPAFIKRAVEELDTPDFSARKSAIYTLRKAEYPVTKDIFVNALRHPLPDVRLGAAVTLGLQGDQRATDILVGEVLPYRSDELLLHSGGVRASEVKEAFIAIGRPTVPKLFEALKSDNKFYADRIAGLALAEILDATDVPLLLSWLVGEEVVLRVHAANLLGSIGNEAAVQPLLDLWNKSNDDRELRAASSALVTLQGERALPIFVEALQTRNLSAQVVAVWALYRIGGDEAVEALIQVARGGDRYEPSLREEVFGALRSFPHNFLRGYEKATYFLMEWERKHP